MSAPRARALIVGDVVPAAASAAALRRAAGLEEPPDLFLFSLDACLAAGEPRPRHTRLVFDPEHLPALDLATRSVAVTATNHLADFGETGTRRTLEELAARGFRHVGAGPDLASAERALDLEVGGGRLSLLALAETAPRVAALPAGDHRPGVAPLVLERAVEAVRLAAERADWVWVLLHWGEEYVRVPDPEQRRQARALIDAGATLVAGAHAHVPLGWERHGAGTVFYGLGNFLFPSFREARGYRYRFHPTARHGIALCAELGAGGWTFSPRGIHMDDGGLPHPRSAPRCPELAAGSDLARYAKAYPWLRRRERARHLAERLLTMSGDERRFRLLRLLGGSRRSKAESA